MAREQTVWPERSFADFDRSAPLPLHRVISSRLEQAISDGDLPAGARLETEIAIAGRLGVSRPTVRRAIQDLVDRGLVVRRRGVGTQVLSRTLARPVELTSLFDDLQASAHEPTTRVLDLRVVPATAEVARDLGIRPGTDVIRLHRLRCMDGVPVASMRNHLRDPGWAVAAADLTDRGLYQLLRSRGVSIRVATQTIGARRCDEAEARLLEIEPGGPVLTMERVAFDDSGRAVECGSHAYRPDRYRFVTTLVAR